MKVITANVNGIRAAARKGFFEWLEKENADVVCLQETKAQMAELLDELYRPAGYHCYFTDAEKKGYSGVGIFTREKPLRVVHTLGFTLADREGRFIETELKDCTIISLYLPSGTMGEVRQKEKYKFMDAFQAILKKYHRSKKNYIICGDWNIVHKEIDIKNFKSNQKTSGCLPEERAWLDNILMHEGFADAFRVVNHEKDQYTWWSHRGNARANNVGWRIDYQIISDALKKSVKKARIYTAENFSDHAPLIIEYDF